MRAPTVRRVLAPPLVAVTAVMAVAVLHAIAAPAEAATRWRWPVEADVARAFHTVTDPFARGQHRGVDLAAPAGTAVRAACAGRVRFAGIVGSSGRTVSVRCGPLIATYLHLDTIATRPGRTVAAGGRIGTVGRSGRPGSPRAHLHLGAREAATGGYVDPLGLLDGGSQLPPLAPLGPAPRGAAPARVPVRVPARVAIASREAPPRAIPWVAWLGAGCLAAAIGAGGLLSVRRARLAAVALRPRPGPREAHR